MNFKEEVLRNKDKVSNWDETYEERLDYEIKIISDKGFKDYFLILQDIINWCYKEGILVGPGRGCLKGDSSILTNKGFKEIKNINIGDRAMAQDGKFYNVLNTFRYKNEDPMLRIRTYYDAGGIFVTPDHKLLVSPLNSDEDVHGKKFSKLPLPVQWVSAENVKEGDMLVIPRAKFGSERVIDLGDYVGDNCEVTDTCIIENVGGCSHHEAHQLFIPRFLKTDYKLGRFLGWWSADGWLVSKKLRTIGLCCHSKDDIFDIPEIFRDLFRLDCTRFPHKTKKVVQYTSQSITIANFLRALTPQYKCTSRSKSLAGFGLAWNKEYLVGLRDGAWKGDGHIGDKTVYSSSSLQLSQELRQVLWVLGIPSSLKKSVRKDNRPDWPDTHIEYRLTASNKFNFPKNQMGFVDENFIYQRVFRVDEGPPEEFVFDIEVEDQHSFVTESYTVHNSSAGSLVAYLLGITKIDPLKYNLMFERFLNPSRPDLPDCDLDFMSSRRQEVFEYVKNKYGEDRTCLITTFSRFHVKQAIRDLCRIYEVPMETVNKLSKVIPTQVKTLKEAMEIPEVAKFMKKNREIYELTEQLEGSIRQKSVHAAGIIITPDNLTNYISTERVKGELCSCFDMQAIDFLGLLKIDILALKTLDVIARTLELANIKQDDLPEDFDDPEVYKVFQEGRTLGVFQFESSLLTGLSKKIAIDDFKTLYATTTIARPGPLHSGEADKYIKRRKGEDEVEFLTPGLEPITEETYGLMLFQEQSMLVSVQLANFLSVEAEALRKVIGKSKGKEAIDLYREKFITGCEENNINTETAEAIWDIIRESGAYSFNKCLTGDTILYRGSTGRYSGFEITIDELYQNWNSKTSVGEKYRDPKRGITICALDSDGRIRPKKIKGVYPNGKQKVYRIETNTGRKIKATNNHRFMGSNFEWCKVSQFKVGDIVLTMGDTETVQIDERKKWNYTGKRQVNKRESCPGKEGFQSGELNPGYINGQYIMFENARKKLLGEGRHCRVCGKEKKRMEFHHIDGNHRNNEEENITLLCVSCHKKEEYKLGRRKRWERGRLVNEEKIISIEYVGEEETYDLEMNTPEHNFVANGFISHNSHAVSYSAISYWCAWLKTHYPKEFLVALMEFEEDDVQGNATRELREMGYKVHPPHINKSERNVHIASDGEIYMGISDVEGVGEKAVDEILENKPYETFDDFMGRVQKRRANSRVVRNLIQAGFFDVFGRRDSLFYTLDPDPYHEWDDEEMLRRQMMVLDIPSSTPLIEYYENPYEKYVEMINLKDIDFNEKVDEYWVKGIILDYSTRESSQNNLQEFFGEKQLMGFFDLDDGTKKVPCFIAPETLSLFSHRIKEGSPVLVKAHTYGKKEKLYVDGVIDLGNLDPDGTLEKYALDGRVKVLESFSSDKNVNVINYVTYHTSKNGKNYARITFENGEQGLCFNLDSNVFKSGEVIVWTSNKAPFINVQQRIS